MARKNEWQKIISTVQVRNGGASLREVAKLVKLPRSSISDLAAGKTRNPRDKVANRLRKFA